MLNVSGMLVFKGFFAASVDYVLDVAGILTIGEFCAIGNHSKIRCYNKITIGKIVRIALESQLFDTNFHYSRNIVTGKIYPHSKEIIIGNYVWIGNRANIMKGTCLPNYSIVAGNSLLNKDYTQDAPQYPTLAGMPAKVIASGNVRVFSLKQETLLSEFFQSHPHSDFYQGEPGIVDESAELFDDFQNL